MSHPASCHIEYKIRCLRRGVFEGFEGCGGGGLQEHSSLSIQPHLQSSVPVDIQEVDKSTAVISYSPPDPEVREGEEDGL